MKLITKENEPNKKIIKAVVYARYSSTNQREESIDQQIRECEEYAKRKDIVIISHYIDRALSAKTDHRPDFLKMIADSAKKQFDIVLVYQLDRFARNRYDSATYKYKLKKNGAKVISVKENISEDPSGIMLEAILEANAEYYSAELAQKINRGLEDNARNGKWIGGTVPLGYKLNKEKYLIVDPIGAKIVQTIFEMYEQGHEAKEIADHLNNKGYKTSLGRKFLRGSFHRMLKNEKYIGVYRYKNICNENGIPPIIDKETFFKIQKRIEKQKYTTAPNSYNPDFLLTGKLICGHCETNMIGDGGTSKNGNKHYYYCCPNNRKKKICNLKSRKKDWLENLVIERSVSMLKQPGFIEEIATQAYNVQEEQKEDYSVAVLENQIKDLKKKLENCLTAVEKGLVSETIMERIPQYENEIKELEIKLAHEKLLAKPFILEKDHIIFFLEKMLEKNENTKKYQEKIISTFIRAVIIRDYEIEIQYNYSNTPNISNKQIISCSDNIPLVEIRNNCTNTKIYLFPTYFIMKFCA